MNNAQHTEVCITNIPYGREIVAKQTTNKKIIPEKRREKKSRIVSYNVDNVRNDSNADKTSAKINSIIIYTLQCIQ